MTKKEAKVKYNKIKKNFKKNIEFSSMKASIISINDTMKKNVTVLEAIQKSATKIVNKSNNLDSNKIMDSFPAENLRELAGDFSKKITFRDINSLVKMHKECNSIIEEQNILEIKNKILNIELLQKQIEILLNENED